MDNATELTEHPTMAEKTKPLLCPVCGKPAEFSAPPVGFFCSDRCKMIDLGKWLGEDYRISEPLRPDHFEEFEELSGDKLDAGDGQEDATHG